MGTRLYVGNLPYNFGDDELRELFVQAGSVESATVIKDRETGQSRGFGFVEMTTSAEAEAAIRTLDGYTAGNRQLRVSLAREREASRSPR
jgi:cold-inducible RNA-binding protein